MDLYRDMGWILREVDSIDFGDSRSIWKTSLTINCDSLRRRIERLEEQSGTNEIVASQFRRTGVPIFLGLLPKRLLGSFSVTSAEGVAIALSTRSYSSSVAAVIMDRELSDLGLSFQGIDRKKLLEDLYLLAHSNKGSKQEAFIDLLNERRIEEVVKELFSGKSTSILEKTRSDIGHNLGNAILSLIEGNRLLSRKGIPQLARLTEVLSVFAKGCLPFISTPYDRVCGPDTVVKYRIYEKEPKSDSEGLSLLKRVLTPVITTINVPSTSLATHGGRHVVVNAPDGCRLTDVQVLGLGSNYKNSQDAPTYVKRVTPHSASIATFREDRSVAVKDIVIRISMMPSISRVLNPAIAAVLASIVVLGVGLSTAASDYCNNNPGHHLSRIAQDSSGAAVAIMLLIPTVYQVVFAYGNEHRLATKSLTPVRRVVLLSAFMAVSAVVPPVFSLHWMTTLAWWTLCLIGCIVTLAMLVLHSAFIQGIIVRAKREVWYQTESIWAPDVVAGKQTYKPNRFWVCVLGPISLLAVGYILCMTVRKQSACTVLFADADGSMYVGVLGSLLLLVLTIATIYGAGAMERNRVSRL